VHTKQTDHFPVTLTKQTQTIKSSVIYLILIIAKSELIIA